MPNPNYKNEQKSTNVMSEYLLKLQLIVSNTEFMNTEEARKYETLETKMAGEAYVAAALKKDSFASYEWKSTTLVSEFREIGVPSEHIVEFVNNPSRIPYNLRILLLRKARKHRIASYEEQNKYYLNLAGLPLEREDPFIQIPEEFYHAYRHEGIITNGQYIHTLPPKYQELFMNTTYYKELLQKYPDVQYLKHLGSYAIPIEVSRAARDGDILKINESKLQTYHPKFGNVVVQSDLVHAFTKVYRQTQKYIYNNLRGDFSQIYPNYNNFIRFLTIYMTIGQCMNEFLHKSSKLIYMNNMIANDYFSLYGLPSVLMEGNSLTKFLKKFRLLLMDKGTNVVYRVKDLIGYEYTDIYTLVMVKQQLFKNGYPVYYIDEDGEKHPQQEIVFRRLGTAEDNTSYFQYKNSTTTYTVDEITSGDPRWWNTPEVERMIQEMNYTLSNSKYIQLSTAMSMDDIWWQTCILLRGLLDHKTETKGTIIGISQSLNGESSVSIFDAVLILIILMNWKNTDFNGNPMHGNLYLPNGFFNYTSACIDMLFNGLYEDGSPKPLKPGLPYKVASFNYELKNKDYAKYLTLQTYDYLEPDRFIPMLDQILSRQDINIGEVIMTNEKLLFGYLETKLRTATTIHEFRQVTDAYNWLFLVDPVRNWNDTNSYDTDALLMQSYGITQLELYELKRAFRNDMSTNNGVIEVVYKGTLYRVPVYDIMNNNVLSLNYPFSQQSFVVAFNQACKKWKSNLIENRESSNTIKDNYQSIIMDKVMLDISGSQYGPTSFEALLYRNSPTLYRALELMKEDSDQLLILMRSIIRALEEYVNHPLPALEFMATGRDNYIEILKEVITYFKSYMVEFTKEEFRYIMGGMFDHGGNSNMLALFDQIDHITIRILPRDVLHLYDVSCAKARVIMDDHLDHFLYDEAIFRVKGTYQKIKDAGYEIWYDNGEWIDQTPLDGLKNNDIVIAELIRDNSGTYKIIINKENIITV